MELSFRNDPSIKSALIARMDAHAAADEIIKGTGWEEGKGCFIGCSLNNYDHSQWPVEFGLPEWMAYLCDEIFEGLPNADAMAFATDLPRRIPVGVNLEPVQHWIAIARIDRMLETHRKALEASHAPGVHEAITRVVTALEVGRRAHEAAAGGNSCELELAAWSAHEAAERAEWSSRSAAARWADPRSATAAWAAAAAAWAASRSAAERLEEAVAWAAVSAARSAATAERAWAASRSAAYQSERDALYSALDKAALAQQPAAVFRNDGNTEADFIAHEANACTACGGSGHKADQQPAAVDEKYAELIYAVANKYPGESRHETALRYIRQAESADHGDAQAATQPRGSDNDQ